MLTQRRSFPCSRANPLPAISQGHLGTSRVVTAAWEPSQSSAVRREVLSVDTGKVLLECRVLTRKCGEKESVLWVFHERLHVMGSLSARQGKQTAFLE